MPGAILELLGDDKALGLCLGGLAPLRPQSLFLGPPKLKEAIYVHSNLVPLEEIANGLAHDAT